MENKPSSKTEGSQPLLVRHPAKMKDDQVYVKQTQYFTELLNVALKNSGIPSKIKALKIPAVIDSRVALLLEGNTFDVIWLHTNREYEERFLPIRIPLFKGLIGWRVFAVQKNDLATFSTINSSSELKELFAGQGYDWPDTAILQANKFNISTSVHPSNLYGMLIANRLDYFPRSILEIDHELQQENRSELITVEPSLALQYPSAFYFFVRKDHVKLAKAIETGLEKAIADGSFNTIFYKYFSGEITKQRFDQRTVFSLTEPKEAFSHLPLHRKELWFQSADKPEAKSSANIIKEPRAN